MPLELSNQRLGESCRRQPGFRLANVRLLCALALASAAATAISPPLHAQTNGSAVIAGRVQNAATGNYLNNARVRVVGTNLETFTNSAGEYRISGLSAGQATLDVFYTGLAPQRLTAVVPAAGEVQKDVELRTLEAEAKQGGTVVLSQFVVQSQRETDAAAIAINEQRFAANRKDVISTDAFGDINQGNIGEFVKFIPGISLDVKDGNSPSGIMIRGFDPNYTNVTMDGGSLASTQIANTQTSSRGFLLEQANINDLSRIEVSKLPTPDMSANLLGGSVNFISKSAFERSRESLNFNVFLSGNSNELSFNKSFGPGSQDTYKVRPNFDMTWVKPFNRKFGIVVNLAHSTQFYLQNKSVPTRRYYTGTNGNANFLSFATNPQTLAFATSYNPNQIDRTSGSIKLDWKPADRNVISFGAGANANYQQNAARTLTYNTGATVLSWDAHNTFGSTGAAGTGTANEGNSYQNRNGLMRYVKGSWTYTANLWAVELAGSYSNSNNKTRDIAKGFWNGLSTSLPNVKTVNLEGIDNSSGSFAKASVLNATGGKIDELSVASYLLGKVTSQPQTNTDDVKEVRLNVTRNVKVLGTTVAVKGGGLINDMTRDQHYSLWETTYAGPDGILSSGDETAAAFADTKAVDASPGFGRAAPQWIDPYRVFQAFQQHPTWFVRAASNMGDTVKNVAVRSPWLHETIRAGYLMGDAKLFSNRLRLVGGVRYELTKDEGRGYKQDGNAIYQLDASGHPLKNAAGAYILLPSPREYRKRRTGTERADLPVPLLVQLPRLRLLFPEPSLHVQPFRKPAPACRLRGDHGAAECL
jgi:TonB-dependent receptor